MNNLANTARRPRSAGRKPKGTAKEHSNWG
jgi:hypothetical protein